ncbi:pentatricopeptide repeat-containing protein At5g11310, mitochondrial [Impatiens glandulifera]|uniref:pentatricopeptide repeat-containing protein At5g11310, mitochondrial n=1 Tax=Impatiens glandulifera TaxID=253017 RepID=UPI001FB0E1BA|nr:pentatricopeptide repeat-containing protein At5g11310, mitochondrial [Impatiens glandulifera]
MAELMNSLLKRYCGGISSLSVPTVWTNDKLFSNCRSFYHITRLFFHTSPVSSLPPPPDSNAETSLIPLKLNPNSNFIHNDFTAISDLVSNSLVTSGRALELALDGTGIGPTPSLLQQAFDNFGTKYCDRLLNLFLWAERKPGYCDSVSVFNSMVNVLVNSRQFEMAWCLIFSRLKRKIEGPYMDVYVILIRQYARTGSPFFAIRTFEFACTSMLTHDAVLEDDLFVTLVESLCKKGYVHVASQYFEQRRELGLNCGLPVRIYSILLHGWFLLKDIECVEKLWEKMKKENLKHSVLAYGTLVNGYCHVDQVNVALNFLGEMQREGLKPNAIAYNAVINGLAKEGRLKEALGMLDRLLVSDSGPSNSTYDSLVKGFCKVGDVPGANKIVKMMINRGFVPTIMTYNYFFRHFSRLGKTEEAMSLYIKLIELGYIPDSVTCDLLIRLLCEQERLDLVIQVRKEMRARECELGLSSWTALIHFLCKMHRFEDAIQEFKEIREKGIIPLYPMFTEMIDELKAEGMNKIAEKLCDMMDSVPYSMMSARMYGRCGSEAAKRKTSILQKAKHMSDILKSHKEREFVTRGSRQRISKAG